jgi:O-antigen/teichoic acid export membrane protein
LDDIRLAASRRRALGPAEFLRFALLALVGGELWVVAGQLSFYLTSRSLKTDEGALFGLYRQLAEPAAFLAAAAWTVLYGHVARAWEDGDRPQALFRLQTAYKAVALGTMTLTVLVQAASPLWLRLLDERWRRGAALLPGLLLFFQMMGNLGLANLWAWLLERPALAMLPPAAGAAANLLLAAWWMPAHGPEGAAWAAGVGLAAGGGLAAVAGLLLGRLRTAPSTWLLLLGPCVLPLAMLASWAPAAAWALVLAAAATTPWIFDRDQKAFLRAAAERAVGAFARRPS